MIALTKPSVRTWIAAFTVLVLFVSLSVSANAGEETLNQVDDWCDDGVKYEPVDTPFIVPEPPEGATWTLIVLKAGTTNETHTFPQAGETYSHSSKENSHVILCWVLETTSTSTTTTITSPTTTTSTQGSTTTTDTSTTTTVGSSTTTSSTSTSTTDPTTTTSTTVTTTSTVPQTTSTVALTTTTSTTLPTSTTSSVPVTTSSSSTIPSSTTTTTSDELPNTGADDLTPLALTGGVLLLLGLSLLYWLRATGFGKDA